MTSEEANVWTGQLHLGGKRIGDTHIQYLAYGLENSQVIKH